MRKETIPRVIVIAGLIVQAYFEMNMAKIISLFIAGCWCELQMINDKINKKGGGK